MDINDYLTKLSQQLSLSNTEKKKIDDSVAFLRGKIWGIFQDRLEEVSVFGSYDRGTMLPQSIDTKNDVDILVVFKKDEFQPQTYLNQLRSFSEKYIQNHQYFLNILVLLWNWIMLNLNWFLLLRIEMLGVIQH